MPKPEIIARQSGHPSGVLGHVVARVMALDTARVNGRVLEVLEPKPGERILELGCGHGRALHRLAEQVPPGLAAGVDPSTVMLSVARRRCRRSIAAGHARIDRGDSTSIPWPDECFDKVFSVHTLYFWPELGAGLREILRVLRPGGELLLGFHPRENEEIAAELPRTVYTLHTCEEVAAELEGTNYRDLDVRIDPASGIALARARR